MPNLPRMPPWTGHDARLALCVALCTLLLHHCANPHGSVLEAPVGTEVTLIRTFNGWTLLQDDTATHVTKVRINAAAVD